ncbi:SNF2 family N-terminal domain-containing protein [Astrocystis sublimbata]|nr:SNF2 family N-terminal domain-containing protein [Astrocystis sublimbata]
MMTINFARSPDTEMTHNQICYGALYDAKAKTLSNTKLSNIHVRNNISPFAQFPVQAEKHTYVLYSDHGEGFAILDTRTTSHLGTLSDIPLLRLEAIIESNIFSKRLRGRKQNLETFALSINIFGSRTSADSVADRLSKVSAFLQHPYSLDAGIEYYNPQLLIFADDALDMRDLVGIGNFHLQTLQTNIIGEVGRILESLTHEDDVSGQELELPIGLLSQLKKHQKDALRFILQREERAVTQQLSRQLSQSLEIISESPLSPCAGGLIADVMGLGKTLTMLTAIVQTFPAAEDFAHFYMEDRVVSKAKPRTKATLVIVSSVQVLESWISEIQIHFTPDALRFIRFHGSDRTREMETLKSGDLVLTTYHTSAADAGGQRTLNGLEWYRVVLDETHSIRNSSSKQFRAVTDLDTQKRWCLTGTPIQNKLHDLASLAHFLQLPPVSTKASFQKHILEPLSENGPHFARPLQNYLEAYCLRRTEKCLTLPPCVDNTYHLTFPPKSDDFTIQYSTRQDGKSTTS